MRKALFTSPSPEKRYLHTTTNTYHIYHKHPISTCTYYHHRFLSGSAAVGVVVGIACHTAAASVAHRPPRSLHLIYPMIIMNITHFICMYVCIYDLKFMYVYECICMCIYVYNLLLLKIKRKKKSILRKNILYFNKVNHNKIE